jgi:hypothetical protein
VQDRSTLLLDTPRFGCHGRPSSVPLVCTMMIDQTPAPLKSSDL